MEANGGSKPGGEVPPLLADVEVSNLAGFDVTAPSPRPQASPRPLPHPNMPTRPRVPPLDRVPRRGGGGGEVVVPAPLELPGFRSVQPVSVSLPASPSGFSAPIPVGGGGGAIAGGDSEVDLRRQAAANAAREPHHSPGSLAKGGGNGVRFVQPERMMFRSQPIHGGQPSRTATRGGGRAMSRDKRYDSFKTWSGKLERQLTHLAGVGPEAPVDKDGGDAIGSHRTSSLPKVDRFFAALEGPELDQLKSEEELVLPSDKTWPFLLRFPVSAFGICLGVSSQAILWKTIATSAPTTFLHVTTKVNLVLWCVSVALMCAISVTYGAKVVFFFEAVRREYYHPIRVNFFFAPWIACLFLAIGVPASVATTLPHWLWYALMAPVLCLELKIYGQWMSGGQRRLSKVANPSNHLSVVGNFVGALLGASMGLREGPVFFFAVGMAHYSVLFVTLYQRLPTNETLPKELHPRLPTNETLPKELHPVFFLFVAAPSVASMAWARITGEFGLGSRLAYFIAMFLYASLAVRINFFRGFRFSLAWWAYTFPMTGAAIASIRYSTEVDNALTKALCVALSVVATLTVTALFATTMVHAFVLHKLFPNDIAIAITDGQSMIPIKELHEMNAGAGDDDDDEDIESGAAKATAAARGADD
uniref:Uncharacterized protein n=1 Tax=Oryza punctata TaxID=4537 RepID=A0A0E0KZV7_ORYPU